MSLKSVWSPVTRSWFTFGAFVCLYPVLGWLFDNWYAAGGIAGFLAAAASALRHRYVHNLTARAHDENEVVWQVLVNEVDVGTITDTEYAAIRLRTLSDRWVYAAQAANLLRVLLNTFDYVYRAIPLGMFWVAIALLAFWPDTAGELLAGLREMLPEQAPTALANLARLLSILMLVSFATSWLLGMSRFGFVNRFDEAVNNAVRKHCNVPAEGTLVLLRYSNAEVTVPNAMNRLKRPPTVL